MSNNTYQKAAEQAWTTYTKTQAKYRGGEYQKLLEPLYKTFLQQLGSVEEIVDTLEKTRPASDKALQAAADLFDKLQSTFGNIAKVIAQFPGMDAKVVNKAATLDQVALKKTYAQVQGDDLGLEGTFAACLFDANQSAARAMKAFAPPPAVEDSKSESWK